MRAGTPRKARTLAQIKARAKALTEPSMLNAERRLQFVGADSSQCYPGGLPLVGALDRPLWVAPDWALVLAANNSRYRLHLEG